MLSGRDNRAVSTLIGVVLIFGVVIILFSVYQAELVPNQNKQVEFNHLQVVENEMTQFRADVLNAKRNGEERTSTVTLGTRYPDRIIGLNPPDPSGSLRTKNQGEVAFNGLDGLSSTTLCSGGQAASIESESVVYEPGYHEIRNVDSVSYENTFVARSFREAALFGPHDLVQTNRSGYVRKLDLVVVTGNYSETRVDSVSIDINATETNETTRALSDNQFRLTVPSRFGPTEWENEILSGVSVSATENNTAGAEKVDLVFDTTDEVIVGCTAVGVGSQNPSAAYDPLAGSGAADGINPSAPGDIKLEGANLEDDKAGKVSVDFSNLGNTDTEVVQARINFYNLDSQGKGQGGRNEPTEAKIASGPGFSPSETLTIGGTFEDVSNLDLIIPKDAGTNNPSTIWLDFDSEIDSQDWFILTLQFKNGETGQYFVSVP